MKNFILGAVVLLSMNIYAAEVIDYDFNCTIQKDVVFKKRVLRLGDSWHSLRGNYYGSLSLPNLPEYQTTNATLSKSAYYDNASRELGYTPLYLSIPGTDKSDWVEIEFNSEGFSRTYINDAELNCYRLNKKIQKI
jgi:hypothetical protein